VDLPDCKPVTTGDLVALGSGSEILVGLSVLLCISCFAKLILFTNESFLQAKEDMVLLSGEKSSSSMTKLLSGLLISLKGLVTDLGSLIFSESLLLSNKSGIL